MPASTTSAARSTGGRLVSASIPGHVPKNDRHPAAIRAVQIEPDFRALLIWSRFPYYEVVETGTGTVQVTLADMRFGSRRPFTARALVPGP